MARESNKTNPKSLLKKKEKIKKGKLSLITDLHRVSCGGNQRLVYAFF